MADEAEFKADDIEAVPKAGGSDETEDAETGSVELEVA